MHLSWLVVHLSISGALVVHLPISGAISGALVD